MSFDIISQVDFFEPLPSVALAALVTRARTQTFRTGSLIMRQGEFSPALHVIVRGRVHVERAHPLMAESLVLAEAEAGDVVGELGILDGDPCLDTIRAVEDTDTMEFAAGSLVTVLLDIPELSPVWLPRLSRRLRTHAELTTSACRNGGCAAAVLAGAGLNPPG